MMKKILIGLGIVVVVFVIMVMMQPSKFTVARSATINAKPAAIFPLMNDLHNWNSWSPWAKIDPNQKVTYEGSKAGVGSAMHWAGNDQVGEGRMTIVASKPNEQIDLKLDFIKPFASKADVTYSLKPEGAATVVTWSMTGENKFLAKCFSLFMNMDKMIGGDFEKGLANLKGIAETRKK